MSTAHLSTLPPTITCPSTWPPNCLAHTHLPVRPATHLVCEPYAPLTHGLSQAPSTCLPPNGILPAPHGLPASLTLPPRHLHHVTSHNPALFLSHPAAPGPPMHTPPRAPTALLHCTDTHCHTPLMHAHPCQHAPTHTHMCPHTTAFPRSPTTVWTCSNTHYMY